MDIGVSADAPGSSSSISIAAIIVITCVEWCQYQIVQLYNPIISDDFIFEILPILPTDQSQIAWGDQILN